MARAAVVVDRVEEDAFAGTGFLERQVRRGIYARAALMLIAIYALSPERIPRSTNRSRGESTAHGPSVSILEFVRR